MVNPGAEVIADGSIHVYAPLRGKAIAGARGNTDARIVTLCLEPELVSIAGVYRTSDVPLPAELLGQPTQLRLDGGTEGRLVMQPLEFASSSARNPMARIIVVTSGKGGVGKTTTSASFASGLALAGHKTAVIDFDVGLRNLDLIMGCERRVVYDFVNVVQGEATLNQALIKDKHCDNLSVLAASQTRDKDALTKDGVERVLNDLAGMGFEYIVCDSPAGIETGALMAMHFADEALVVTNPEVSSVRDSDRILGMLASKTKRAIEGKEPVKEHLLITRYNPNRVDQGQMLSLEDIQDILRIQLIGVIPESETVLQASNQGMPAVHLKGSDVSEAYKDVVDRFLGKDKPMRFVDAQKQGFLKRLFGRPLSDGVVPLLPARREEEDRLGRQGAAADHPGARALRPQRRRARLPARAAARPGGGDRQVHQDRSRRHQGPARAPGQPGGAGGEDRVAGRAVGAPPTRGDGLSPRRGRSAGPRPGRAPNLP